MEAPAEKRQVAWQPLTPKGVAAFASARLGRLLIVQFVFALGAAMCVIWFLHRAWFPVIGEAIRQLPMEAGIRAGRLEWHGDSPRRLAEGRFLALAVDLRHEGRVRSPAQLTFEFGETDLKVFSLLGFSDWSYPPAVVASLNRDQAGPWWGAWSAPVLAITAALVIVSLLIVWAFLAAIYSLPVSLVGFFADRDLTLKGGCRLAGAALLPGALLLCGAIVLYGLGALDLVRLGVAFGLHFIVGWLYLVAGVAALPRHPAALGTRGNPFR